jgi:hypothetical protein
MRAFDPEVVGAMWAAVEPLLPVSAGGEHPPGLSSAPDRRPAVFRRDLDPADGLLVGWTRWRCWPSGSRTPRFGPAMTCGSPRASSRSW